MRPKRSGQPKASAERIVKDIRCATRLHFSAGDKIGIVLEGLRGDDGIAELCRKESIAQSLYYTWSKEFMEAGSPTEFIPIASIMKAMMLFSEMRKKRFRERCERLVLKTRNVDTAVSGHINCVLLSQFGNGLRPQRQHCEHTLLPTDRG